MKTIRKQRGFTMMEVLVSVLIVSFGMLGIAATLFTANRSATSSYVRQQAVQDAYDILDRMRANHTVAAVAGGSYTTSSVPSSAPSPNCSTSTCTGTQMAAYDVWQWETNVSTNLPQGVGSVTIAAGSTNTYTVTVSVTWSDQAGSSAFTPQGATASNTTQTYTVVSAL
ncbi:type IV pilus modification protein PilV [Dyella acidisoli]|nr:type IV pilus modification protein PilV [Dyella acidisoli]